MCVTCNNSIEKYTIQTETINGKKNYKLFPESVSGYSLYDNDSGFFLVKPKESINLLCNPTFFLDLDFWESHNCELLRTNLKSKQRGYSLKIKGSGNLDTLERREYAQTQIFDFQTGVDYVLSFYVLLPKFWDINDRLIGTISIVDDNNITIEEIFSLQVSNVGVWQRLSVTKTIREDATKVFVRLNLRSQNQKQQIPPYSDTGFYNLVNEYVYFDYGVFEKGSLTTPFNGDTQICSKENNYNWLGIPHKSPSIRDKCARDGGELLSLSEFGISVLEHSGHNFPTIENNSISKDIGATYQNTVIEPRLLTLSIAACSSDIRNIFCDLLSLNNIIKPNLNIPDNSFLLLYKRNNCNSLCVPDTLSLCVNYVSGFESELDNLHQVRLDLEFIAYNPFWREFPGESGIPLNFVQPKLIKKVIKIDSIGKVFGFNISVNDIRVIETLEGINAFVVGGQFDSINNETAGKNISVHNCNKFCDLLVSFENGIVKDIIKDTNGNVLIAGSFLDPFRYLAKLDENNVLYGFDNYLGNEPLCINNNFWASIIVGTGDGLWILNNKDNVWYYYPSNAEILAIDFDNLGNLYLVGDFDVIDSVVASKFVKFNVIKNGCFGLEDAYFEAYPYVFDSFLTSVKVDKESNIIYVGGNAVNVQALPFDICNVTENKIFSSNGSNQELEIINLGLGIYRIHFRVLNSVVQAYANYCLTTAPSIKFIKIIATNTIGSEYNFIFGTNITSFATSTFGSFFVFSLDIDTNIIFGEPCESLNESFFNQVITSVSDLIIYSTLQLPNGVGYDNTLGNVSVQCIQLEINIQPEAFTINHIAQVINKNIYPIANGLPTQVNTIFLHPITKMLWVGLQGNIDFNSGLALFFGNNFIPFNGIIGGLGLSDIIDIRYSNTDNSIYLLTSSDNEQCIFSGVSELDYAGDADNFDFEIIIHGSGQLLSLDNVNLYKKLMTCLEIQCNEYITFNFLSGFIYSNFRDLLESFLYSGSRKDFSLTTCDNIFNLLVLESDENTSAVLLYVPYYWGINAVCCNNEIVLKNITECCRTVFVGDRNPTDNDCNYDVWLNLFGCTPRIFINTKSQDNCICGDGIGDISNNNIIECES